MKQEEAGRRGQKLQSHYWPWICLLSPIAGLPLASSTRQFVMSSEVRKTKAYTLYVHMCVFMSFYTYMGIF